MGRPNVLFITADQWRGDCLGVAGHPVVETPNIDRLAGQGTVFLRHYAQAVPCGPSRASLYTGLYQMNHRVVRNGTPLDAHHDNIALAMGRLGYRPTLFGYTDQAVDPRTVPADSPWLRTYEGILPGFEVRVHLPEHPEAWLAWLERRGVAVPEDHGQIHVPPAASRPATSTDDRWCRSSTARRLPTGAMRFTSNTTSAKSPPASPRECSASTSTRARSRSTPTGGSNMSTSPGCRRFSSTSMTIPTN